MKTIIDSIRGIITIYIVQIALWVAPKELELCMSKALAKEMENYMRLGKI